MAKQFHHNVAFIYFCQLQLLPTVMSFSALDSHTLIWKQSLDWNWAALWQFPPWTLGGDTRLNQSHVAPVGASLRQVWRKNFAQLERETEGAKWAAVQWGGKRHKPGDKRLPHSNIFKPGRVYFFSDARWRRRGKERTRFCFFLSSPCSCFCLKLSLEFSGCEKRTRL